jgi:3-oxoacyl-[acyl-carrier protein] reductase
MDLVSDTAIVTGAAQGIGKGIAEGLLEHGTGVAIADVNAEGAEETSTELNDRYDPNAVAVECDVTDSSDVADAVETTVAELGDVGILVNNAGVAELARTWEMPEEEWDRAVDVCLKGTFLCTKAVINHMLDSGHGGAIVNVSSLNYTAATDGLPHYSAAKAGVSQFTKVVASEAGRHGIRVNAVAPGSTRTPLTEANGLTEGKIAEEFLDRTVLERRFGEPEDVARVVAFLASDHARWVTGETVSVDGGQHIRGLHSYWDVLEEMGAFEE